MQLLPQSGNSEERSGTLSQEHPECYAWVKKELQSAQLAEKNPKDVWHFLLAELGHKSALGAVIEFFISAYPYETNYYVYLLRYYVEKGDNRAQDENEAHLPSSQSNFKFSADERMTSLKVEIGKRLREVSEEVQSSSPEKVERLCKVAAALVFHKILPLEDLWPYMGSTDHLAQSESIYKGLIDAKVAELQSVYDDNTYDASARAEMIFSSLSEPEDAQKTFDIKLNQPCSLHISFLQCLWKKGDTETVLDYIDAYKGLALIHEPLRASLATHLFGFLKDKKDKDISPEALVHILMFAIDKLGPLFGLDFALFQEVSRHCANLRPSDKSTILEILYRGILPAFSLYRVNRDAAKAVWSCIRRGGITIRDRLWLYKKWQTLYEEVHILRAVKVIVERDVKVLMRTIEEEVSRPACRAICSIAKTNPIPVWKQVLECALEKKIPVPDIMKIVRFSDDLAEGAFFFTLLDVFKESKRPQFKQDGVSYEDWFSTLSMLAASFFSESTNAEEWFSEYLDFICKDLKTSSGGLLLLSNLLSCMSGIKPIDEYSDAQLEVFGGSRHLIREFLCPTDSFTIRDIEDDIKYGSSKREDAGSETMFLSHNSYELPIEHLFVQGLCDHGVSEHVLSMILKCQRSEDLSFLLRSHSMDWQDRSTLVLKQLLVILEFGSTEYPDAIPKGSISCLKNWRSYSASFAKYMDIARVFLRSRYDSLHSHLDSYSPKFLEDFAHASYKKPSDVNDDVFALFWLLEMYDLYVPGPSYLREIERISALEGDRGDLAQFIIHRTHIVETLKASYEEHTGRVAWVLKNLPLFEFDSCLWSWLLRDMIIHRAVQSKLDAGYVFYFLSCTFDNPLAMLQELFEPYRLGKQISDLSDLEMQGFAYFLNLIWRDVRTWSSLGAGDIQQIALCEGLRKKVTGTPRVCWDHCRVPGTDAGLQYSLFRPGKGGDAGKDMQSWSENLSGVVIESLNSRSAQKRNKGLILAIGVPEIVLYTSKGESLQKDLAKYLDRFAQNARSAELVQNLISVLNEYEKRKDACGESGTDGAPRHDPNESGGESGHARCEELTEQGASEGADDGAPRPPSEKRATEEPTHGSKRPCIGM